MYDTLRPALKPGLVSRTRSDGSVGIYDPKAGRAVEASEDQAALFSLIDGARALPDIAGEHHTRHGFVPFAALKDLLVTLAAHGMLTNPADELAANGLPSRPNWMHRIGARAAFGVPLPAGRSISISLAVICLALAGDSLRQELHPLAPLDVLWFFAGAALALSVRNIFKAAAGSVGGAVPQRFVVGAAMLVPFAGPDAAQVALLDKWPRAVSHLFALLGSLVAVGIGATVPGLFLGALAVLLVDLCPFAPTSMGRLMATLAGRVDLREHVRAYLSRRFLKRVTSSRFFAGEGNLIFSALLGLAWISLVVRLLLTQGLIVVLQLLALGMGHEGGERLLAYFGALVLTLLMPASLVVLVAAVARAFLALRPPQAAKAGASTGAAVKADDFGSIPLFSRLPKAELEALVTKAQELKFQPGHPIVLQGTESDFFFAIREGLVAVTIEEEDGFVREVTRLGPGDCFGETALLEAGMRTASVWPVTETRVAGLSRADFESLRDDLAGVDVKALLRATAALKKSAVFQHLPAARQSALAMKLEPRELAAGEVVVTEGDKGEQFFLIAEGEFEVVEAQAGRVNTLKPGDHFGEVALLRDVPRTATVRALTAGKVMALSKQNFIAGVAADLGLSSSLERLASERTGAQA
jgi:cAMP-dependent protein kinase regulator